MKAGITNSYNALVWNTVKQVTAFSITEGKYVGGKSGTISFPGVKDTCVLGSNLAGNQCVEPSHLLVQKTTLTLNIATIKIETCMTVQLWVNFKTYLNDPLGNPVVLL
jgi:hypothetical protein